MTWRSDFHSLLILMIMAVMTLDKTCWPWSARESCVLHLAPLGSGQLSAAGGAALSRSLAPAGQLLTLGPTRGPKTHPRLCRRLRTAGSCRSSDPSDGLSHVLQQAPLGLLGHANSATYCCVTATCCSLLPRFGTHSKPPAYSITKGRSTLYP